MNKLKATKKKKIQHDQGHQKKIGNAPNDPELNDPYIVTPKAKILLCFALRLTVSEIQLYKASKNGKFTERPLNSQKYYMYTKSLSMRPNFRPFHSMISCSEIQRVQGRRKSEMHQMTSN